jgi:N-acetylglucosaminyldiphosphoundecaprenol N-acetyl-beta-D-mannosaminyltransferase
MSSDQCADDDRSAIFGIRIDRVTMDQAISRLGSWIDQKERACRYVVTPNLDHAVQLQSNEALREAYRSASLVVADGWPLVTASRLFRDPLPERVAGSDLVPGLFEALHKSPNGGTVYLLGAAPGVAEHAARKIEQRWSRVKVVGTHSPPFGFDRDPAQSEDAIRLINQCSPDVLVVGLGAPKQELWLKQFQSQLSVGVAIAAGGTIDFLAGRQTRAPRWVQKLRMEWSHRLLTNPGRLTGRYARNAWHLPRLLLQEHFARKANFRPRQAR